jgi:prevent-host-death family protein
MLNQSLTDWFCGVRLYLMATIPAFEAKTKFGELLDRVMGGEEIVITRHEKPVARLIPEGAQSLEGIRRAAEGLEALQKEIAAFSAGRRAVSWKEFKSLVAEGRR